MESFRKSAATIAAAMLAFAAQAYDGAYDPNFGTGGQTWIDVTSANPDVGSRLIQLPNGNFLAAGACSSVACAAWLTPSGQLAAGYGSAGAGTVWFSDFPGWPADTAGLNDAMAFPDNRVAVAVGRASSGAYLALLRANGAGLDPSVGNGAGYTSAPYYARFMRLTADNKIIVVSEPIGQANIIVSRYDSTFHPDTTFGSGGSTTIGFANGNIVPNGMTLQHDGKIVVIGVVYGSVPLLAIVRLTAGGVPDPNFGTQSDGRFSSDLGNTYDGSQGFDIVEDAKNRLVFVGRAFTTHGSQWLVDRVLSGGATDASFNGGLPRQFTIFSSLDTDYSQAWRVALQSDHRIVVAGTMGREPIIGSNYNYYFAMARLMDDGTLDDSWGIGGQSYGDMSTQGATATTDELRSMVLVPGGTLVGGYTQVNSGELRFSVTKMQVDLLFANDFE